MLTALLAVKSLRNRLLTTSLTVAAIALSVMLLVGVENVRTGVRESFAETISQTDLIVGSRGGSTQLLLYSVFGLGSPTNTVSWEAYERFRDHPAVAWTIPYSLGDSHRGFRVIGTTEEFYRRYRYRDDRAIALRAGRMPVEDREVALGAEVAARLGYRVGDHIELTHGLGPMSFVTHDQHPFEVVGILDVTSTPVDRALYVSLEGIEAMHEGFEAGPGGMPGFGASPPPGAADGSSVDAAAAPGIEAITSFFVGTRSRVDALRLQRDINTYPEEPLSAILPGVALAELWRTIGYAEAALGVVTAFVVVVGLLGMIVALYTSLNERRREMAILRAVGAKRRRIVSLLVLESGFLALVGSVLGVALVYAVLFVTQGTIERYFGLFVPIRPLGTTELLYVAAVVAAGFLLGLIPALKAYRNALVDGLSVRV